MKQLLTFVALLTVSLVMGQTKNLDSFHGVKSSGSVKVTLHKSNDNRAEVNMIKGDYEDVLVEIKDGILVCKIKNKNMSWSWGNKTKAEIAVYYANDLRKLKASAGSSMRSEDHMKSDELVVDVSSGASCNISVDANHIDVDVSSGASLRIEGNCTSQKVDSSSGASYSAKELKCETAEIDASSGSSTYVWATKSVVADKSSGASVNYKGDPPIQKIR